MAVAVAAIGCAALLFRAPPPHEALPETPQRVAPRPTPRANEAQGARPPAVAEAAMDAVVDVDPALIEAYPMLDSIHDNIRCAAPPELPDGLYADVTTRGHIRYVRVADGMLTGKINGGAGDEYVGRGVVREARIRWRQPSASWGGCEVTIPARIPIRGVLVWPDGAPAAGRVVQGCERGESVLSDADGRFETSGYEGERCHLIPFLSLDGAFGGGEELVIYGVGPEPVEGVHLVLPEPGDVWSDADEAAVAAGLIASIEERGVNPNQRQRGYANALAASRGLEERVSHEGGDASWWLQGLPSGR
jgi:hypothetical protein